MGLDPPAGAAFTKVRLVGVERFTRGTFVEQAVNGHVVIAGALKGERAKQDGKPRLTAQAVLHPVAVTGPCPTCDVYRLNRR